MNKSGGGYLKNRSLMHAVVPQFCVLKGNLATFYFTHSWWHTVPRPSSAAPVYHFSCISCAALRHGRSFVLLVLFSVSVPTNQLRLNRFSVIQPVFLMRKTLDIMRYISYNAIDQIIYGEFIMFHIEFYETEDGKQPVSDFLDSLDAKMAAKMISLMEILEEKGTELCLP